MKLRFQIPSYERPPLSLNKRMHWAVANRHRQELREAVEWGLRTVKRPESIRRPVRIALVWQVKDKRRRDLDNPAPSLKVCVDAVAAWLGIDDSHTDVWPMVRIEQGDAMGLFVEIQDNSDDRIAAMERQEK